MTIQELGDGLNKIESGLSFAHYAWSSAPRGDYGTYEESDLNIFDADNRYAEETTVAYVNLFTRDATGQTRALVESFFKELQEEEVFAWSINTIQYENDTRFIHIEWEVEFC